MADCGCKCNSKGYEGNLELDCKTIENKKWCKFHVPAELFDELNRYTKLVQEYMYRDRNVCACDFATEANHISLKIRLLLRQLEDQVNGLGEEFVDLQKVLCQHMKKLDDAMTRVEDAIKNADDALAMAQEVSQGFDELEETVNGFESRISALENAPQTDTTYALSQSGDSITLTGSDGSTSTVTVMGGAPEATQEAIESVLEGMD